MEKTLEEAKEEHGKLVEFIKELGEENLQRYGKKSTERYVLLKKRLKNLEIEFPETKDE